MKRALLVVGNLSPLATALISAPITAHLLGPGGRGEVAVALLIASLVQVIGAWGVPWAARKDFAEAGPSSVRAWSRRALLASAGAVPVAVGGGLWMSLSYELSRADIVSLVFLLGLSSLAAFRGVLGNLLIAVGLGWLYGAHLVLVSVVTLGGLILLAISGLLTVATALLASAFSLVVAILALVMFVRRNVDPGGSDRVPLALPRRRRVLVWVTQIIELMVSRADLIVVVMLATAEQVGIYSIASIISVATYALATTVVQLSYAPSRWRWGARRVPNTVHISLLGGLLAAAASIPAIELVFPLVFGDQFASVREFVIAVPLMCVAVSLVAPLVALGADGSRWAYLLGCGLCLSALCAILVGVRMSSAPLAVAVVGAGLATSSAVTLTFATRGGVLRPRPREMVAWLKGEAP